jgi:hypothetical protein
VGVVTVVGAAVMVGVVLLGLVGRRRWGAEEPAALDVGLLVVVGLVVVPPAEVVLLGVVVLLGAALAGGAGADDGDTAEADVVAVVGRATPAALGEADGERVVMITAMTATASSTAMPATIGTRHVDRVAGGGVRWGGGGVGGVSRARAAA